MDKDVVSIRRKNITSATATVSNTASGSGSGSGSGSSSVSTTNTNTNTNTNTSEKVRGNSVRRPNNLISDTSDKSHRIVRL